MDVVRLTHPSPMLLCCLQCFKGRKKTVKKPHAETSMPEVQDSRPRLVFKEVFAQSLESVAGQTLRLGEFCTPERIRFIDCKAFCEKKILRIMEYTDPSIDFELVPPYATISYVWKGNYNPLLSQSFNVKGGEDGDRISIDLLRITCTKALQGVTEYLWLDRVCLIQDSKLDKHYQIRNMFRIYSACSVCWVLPGGIGGFVDTDESTTWLERSWTLQELLLPTNVEFLLKWKEGPGEIYGTAVSFPAALGHNLHDGVISIDFDLLPALYESTSFERAGEEDSIQIPMVVLGKGRRIELMMLDSIGRSTKQSSQNTADDDGRHIGIWRMAQRRISKRRIDIVLSIMALFGVTLNPSDYTDSDEDVLKATIDLVKAITSKGQRADWLYASLSSPSFLPPLGVGKSADGGEELDFWYLIDTPLGYINKDGELMLTVQITPTTVTFDVDQDREVPYHLSLPGKGQMANISAPQSSNPPHSEDTKTDIGDASRKNAVDVSGYLVRTETMLVGQPGTHMIRIGRHEQYRMGYLPTIFSPSRELVMFMSKGKENGRDVWHKMGVGFVVSEFFPLSEWKTQDIALGLVGPVRHIIS